MAFKYLAVALLAGRIVAAVAVDRRHDRHTTTPVTRTTTLTTTVPFIETSLSSSFVRPNATTITVLLTTTVPFVESSLTANPVEESTLTLGQTHATVVPPVASTVSVSPSNEPLVTSTTISPTTTLPSNTGFIGSPANSSTLTAGPTSSGVGSIPLIPGLSTMFEPEKTFVLSGEPFLTVPATSQTISLSNTAPPASSIMSPSSSLTSKKLVESRPTPSSTTAPTSTASFEAPVPATSTVAFEAPVSVTSETPSPPPPSTTTPPPSPTSELPSVTTKKPKTSDPCFPYPYPGCQRQKPGAAMATAGMMAQREARRVITLQPLTKPAPTRSLG